VRSLLPGETGEPDLESIYAFPDTVRSGTGRWLRANFVASIDGAIEVGGRSGPLGGPGDHRIFHLLRALADVVLVGAGTVRTEGYRAAKLPAERRRQREAAGQLPVPPICVVTRRGLEPDTPVLEPVEGAPRPLLLTTAAAAERAHDEVRERAELVVCGDDTVVVARAIEALTDRGFRRLLCEGGPQLMSELVLAGLVDELCLTVAPQLAGPGRAGMTGGAPWGESREWSLAGVLEEDGDLFLRYIRS
jgi:riboflavin biosynthesis pyrimidine reductase